MADEASPILEGTMTFFDGLSILVPDSMLFRRMIGE
jgi:hypothetical protein